MNEMHFNKVLAYYQEALDGGARALTGGGPTLEDTGGYYLIPCLLDNVDHNSPIDRDEVFGPIAGIYTFQSENEAICKANDSEFGLAAYVASSDLSRHNRLARALDVGNLMMFARLNGTPGGVVFGTEPHKQSGLNFEHGIPGLAAWTSATGVISRF